MNAITRKSIGLLFAILLYFIVHEGAHLIFALVFEVFKEIKFLGLGMQIDITDPSVLTNMQFAVLNIAGAVASLTTAYLFTVFAKRICKSSNKLFKAVCYYITIALLFTDPIYLSILCGFFGGGDINGIIMFGVAEWAARLLFGFIGIINLCLLIKYVYPIYKAGFIEVKMER